MAATWAEPARVAAPLAVPDPAAAFSRSSQPLSKPYSDLLAKSGFELKNDGTVLDPKTQKAVTQADMPFLLHRLESAQRLKALLQLDMLLSQSDGEKFLTPAEREKLRQIVRESWPFFTLGTRKDFRHFFSLQELEQMNRDPAPTDSATALMMSDPEPADYSGVEAAPALKPVPVPRLLPTPLPPQPVYTSDAEPLPAKAGPPTAPAVYIMTQLPHAGAGPAVLVQQPAALPPAAAPIAAAPIAAAPVPPAPAPAATAPAAAPQAPAVPQVAQAPVAPPAPAAPAPTPVAAIGQGVADAGVMKPWTPPEPPAGVTVARERAVAMGTSVAAPAPAPAQPATASAPRPVQVAAPSAVIPPVKSPEIVVIPAPAQPSESVRSAPPPAPESPRLPTQPVAEAGLPAYREVPHAEFERFLADAPYGREAKVLLKLISDKAVEPSRSRALNAVQASLPQIVFDTARSGLDAYGSLLAMDAGGARSYTIALSPGPIIYQRKRVFGTGPQALISDSAKVYASLHVPFPAVEAARRDAVAQKEERGDWGQERVFADESRRGAYTQQQQAGYLLRKLLRLDAKRGGWDASGYAAEAYARSAQWLFYAKLALDLRGDGFLDPETRATFRQWRDRPGDYRDHLVHTLSAGRVQTLDPLKGNAETQAQFDRAGLADCLTVFRDEMRARVESDREALKKDALSLARGGLIDDEQLEAARKAIDADFAAIRLPEPTPAQCAARYAADAGALRASAALFAEMTQTERAFRVEHFHHEP